MSNSADRVAHASRVLVEPVLSTTEGAARRNGLFSRWKTESKIALRRTPSPAPERACPTAV